MNKILVEVYLPALEQSFDVFIPASSRLSDVIKLLSKALSDLTGGGYAATDDAILCQRSTGDIFNINMTVSELGLKNGSKLMLV